MCIEGWCCFGAVGAGKAHGGQKRWLIAHPHPSFFASIWLSYTRSAMLIKSLERTVKWTTI